MHPSETMKDVQVITVVYDEVEHKRWENNKSGLTLAQGESKLRVLSGQQKMQSRESIKLRSQLIYQKATHPFLFLMKLNLK